MESNLGQTVGVRDKQKHSIFQRFDNHRVRFLSIAVFCYVMLNNTINATSVWMEHTRSGEQNIALWEPFVWEYTSAISTFVLLPGLFFCLARMTLSFHRIGRQVLLHLLCASVFSLFHVALMVLLREWIYAYQSGDYQFGNITREFFYEWRKDIWGYLSWFIVFHAYGFIYKRLKGEAAFISEVSPCDTPATAPRNEATNEKGAQPEHLIVRKLDKEYIVKLDDVEWFEAAGNYVNLHAGNSVYPLRSTMKGLMSQVDQNQFIRVHRSHAINLIHVAHIETLHSGDGEITLNSGAVVSLSRRYKERFKQQLSLSI